MPAMPQRPETSGPSTWQRFNSGTRTFFTKTRTAIMPWTVDDKDLMEIPPTGVNRRVASRTSRGGRNKENLMSTIFGPKDEEKEIESVNDYLDLPRPMPF